MDDHSASDPPASPPTLADLLHDHGERWQIEQHPDLYAWTAVRRPTPTALHVLAALSLAELAAKLEAAESGGPA